MYLISAYFDEKTNKILYRYMDQIAEKTGNTFMTEHKVPPHLTISSIEAKSVDVLLPAFQTLKGNISKGKIQIAAVGQLLPYVMYVNPCMNQYLLDLSRTIYDTYKDIPETTISKYYRYLSWMPHITLGKKLTKEQMEIAFEYLLYNFQPIEAEILQIGIAKVNPHEDVDRIELL